MSWIRQHWDQEYINDAERKIKQTVSLIGFVRYIAENLRILDD